MFPNADFVIEGYVDPTEPLRDEGPFGDHTGYYTLPEPYPVFHVTAITHRKDAVYPATIVGIPPMEDFYIGGARVDADGHNPLGIIRRGCGAAQPQHLEIFQRVRKSRAHAVVDPAATGPAHTVALLTRSPAALRA